MASDRITIVHHAVAGDTHKAIPLCVDRWTLAKTRWRGTAGDGREFGFDLHHPLKHGDLIAEGYVIEQQPEPVLVVELPDASHAALLAWAIGNLHQSLQVTNTELITADDGAVRTLFKQQDVTFTSQDRVFQPVSSASGHHHG